LLLYYHSQRFCICRFKELYQGNHSEIYTCSLGLYLSPWPALQHPKKFPFPPESPCIL